MGSGGEDKGGCDLLMMFLTPTQMRLWKKNNYLPKLGLGKEDKNNYLPKLGLGKEDNFVIRNS
ncbi:MAG: hypothetical protein IPH77_17765 [Ignavibacteria bacterium]|nr:hypothetical protein [Ignavibacteria bacterium]